MFKYDNNALPESISELFVPNTAIHTYHTRNKHNLRPTQSNRVCSLYMYKIFSFIGVHIWNDIQKHIKHIKCSDLAQTLIIHLTFTCIVNQLLLFLRINIISLVQYRVDTLYDLLISQ